MKAVVEKKSSKKKNDANNNAELKKELKNERKKSIVRTDIFSNATLLPTTISYNSPILPDAIFLTTSSGELITTSVNSLQTTLINTEKIFTTSTTGSDHGTNTIEEEKVEEANIIKSGHKTEGNAAATSKKKKKNIHKPSATQLQDENETRKKKKKKNNATSSTSPSSVSSSFQTTVTTLPSTTNFQQSDDLSSVQPTTQLLNSSGLPTAAFVVASGAANNKDTVGLTAPQSIGAPTFANFPLIASGLTAGNLAGFTAQNFTTFSLQSPLLAPSLTIPLYNSLVAVTTSKDGVLPTLTKELFLPGTTNTTQKTTKASKKSKNNNSNITAISQNGTNMTTTRGRKRTAQSRLPAKLKEPAAVARRNARERRRVKMVNDGFLRLRRHVPTDPKNKKLSKVKTLRLAIEYIHHLQQLLQVDSNTKQTTQSIVTSFTAQMSNYEDLDDVTEHGWLQSDTLV